MCPWNRRFVSDIGEPAFAAREALTGREARTLARALLGMTQEEFSRAFRGLPKPFVWTKTTDEILESVGRYCQRTPDSHH